MIPLLQVNGASVDYLHPLQDNDKIEVYTVNNTNSFPEEWSLLPKPALPIQFVLDVHLGKLARRLRLLGFDTLYQNNYDDKTLVQLALKDNRVLLTRDVVLLKHKTVTLGYCLRSQDAAEQITEVISRYKLANHIMPFNRCVECNGNIIKVDKEVVLDQLLYQPHKSWTIFKKQFDTFEYFGIQISAFVL